MYPPAGVPAHLKEEQVVEERRHPRGPEQLRLMYSCSWPVFP